MARGLAYEVAGVDAARAVAVLVAVAGARSGAVRAVAVAGEVAGLLLLELHDVAGQGVHIVVVLHAVCGELELVEVNAVVAVKVRLEPADVGLGDAGVGERGLLRGRSRRCSRR